MTLAPARTQKLSLSTETSLVVGDHLVATRAHPDETVVFDLRAWPLVGRSVQGLFATSIAPRDPGRALLVGRHHHANPYRLYELDVTTAAVTPLPVASSWPDLKSVRVVGERVILVPGGTLGVDGRAPAWWRDGDLSPLGLPAPTPREVVEHEGKRYGLPRRLDSVDVASLPGDEAMVVWFERLYRVSPAGVTPLPTDHLAAAWEPAREGRYGAIDDQGRALMLLHRRFVAVDREGAWSHVAPGAEALTGAAPGPDGTWLLVGEETLYVVSPAGQWVIEVDLRPMRLSPGMALFMPKAVWVAAHGVILVTHAHDVWALDVDAVLKEKRVPMAKHAAKLVASRRAEWKRKLKACGAAQTPLDQLSPLTRGGVAVTHPTWGVGAVHHAADSSIEGARYIHAMVMFEDGMRHFAYVGDGWRERPWAMTSPS